MREVEIPGGTATLRDREDMKMRHRRVIEIAAVRAQPAITKARSALKRDEATGEIFLDANKQPVIDPIAAEKIEYTPFEAQAMLEAQDATIFASLAGWTLAQPMPDSVDDIGDMPPEVYDALSEATKVVGADALVAETNFDADPDRDRPTGSSDSSNESSTEPLSEKESSSTPLSGHAGASTSSESSTD